MRWVGYIGPEGHSGKLRPYVANIAVHLWGCDLLQHWSNQINILAVPRTHNSGKDIILLYTKVISHSCIQEHKATSKPLEVPTALYLKWLTEKPI